MKIDLLTRLTNSVLSQSDTVGKQEAKATAIIAINECNVLLDELKTVLKKNEQDISVANYLSICLAISQQTAEIEQAVCSLKNCLSN